MKNALLTIATFGSEAEANIAKAKLLSSGIDSFYFQGRLWRHASTYATYSGGSTQGQRKRL